MKTKFIWVALASVLSFSTVKASPDNEKIKIKVTEKASPEAREKAKELQLRLDKIQSVDYNDLSKDEKKQVRTELRDIKKEAAELDGVYLYLSAGVILILILLLILL